MSEDDSSTFREGKEVDDQDIHFALKVDSYIETRRILRSKGFCPEAEDEINRTIEKPEDMTGWSRLFVMEPDRNVIELNAEQLGTD